MLPPTWWQSLTSTTVLRAALRVTIPVGLLQASINNGDHWLAGDFSTAVITKSLLTPLVTFLVASVSAAAALRNQPLNR